MADQPNPESGQGAASSELPIPKLETPSADSSTSVVDTEAIAKRVADILRPDIEKTVQSTKDKRIARIEKQLGVGELSELEELGVQIPENVKMEYRLRDIERSRQSPEVPGQTTTSQGSGATLTAKDVSEVVSGLKLDANDAEVLEALRATYRNRDHFEASMARIALNKSNKPTPSAASTTTMTTTPTPPTDRPDVSALSAEYSRLAKQPGKNYARLKEIEEILNKA